MIVPENVEEKIRYLIKKFPHTEWSGVLFYTHEGNFRNSNLVITCTDIYPMDVGTGSTTSYYTSPDITHYMSENPELLNGNIGMVH